MEQGLCREAITSNDYYDLIIDYVGGYPRVEPACYQKAGDELDVAYYARTGIPELDLQEYPYYAIPKCFGLTDLTIQKEVRILREEELPVCKKENTAASRAAGNLRKEELQAHETGNTAALETTGILRLQNAAGLDLTGRGVLVGFVDTGIDYTHPAFRNTDGSTRIAAIWDQTATKGAPPDGFSYGVYYGRETIDEALASEDPRALVPERDELGHGTFLAGTACGNALASEAFSGAAPQSTVAVVKCKQAKAYLREFYFIDEETPCYQENDLMLGAAWLMHLADALQMPLVICIGMGSSMGNHAGEDVLSVLCADFGRRRQRGIVVSAGNEANARHHYLAQGVEEGQTEYVEISVGERVPGFYMELWAEIPEIYRATVISPSGEQFALGDGAAGGSHVFLFEKTRLRIDYNIAGNRLGGQLIYFRFTAPYPGVWTIGVTPEFSIGGRFDCWLPLSGLLTGEVYFLRSNPDTTILAPGYAAPAVTVGACGTASGGNLPESGRGYSSLGQIKPEVLAPGDNVYGPEPGGRYGTRTGTSVAAALAAGGCAQLFQWGVVENNMKYLNSTDLTNLLIRGAVRDDGRVYPNQAFGYGLLEVWLALEVLRD